MSRGRRLARRLVPNALRRRAAGWIAGFQRPTISVIVPMYNVEGYVGDCLRSVLEQDFPLIEVIVVDDGSTDASARIVDRIAAGDRRVRLLSQPNAGQGPARNRALRLARGEFVIFVDSDDLVPPGSFRYLVAALRASDSDFAIAGVRRIQDGSSYRPSWTVVLHERDRIATTIDEFPAAMADVVAHHRLFRRRFWLERIGDFPSGVYEDHVPMVAAYLRARRFDVLSRVVYEWRLRAEGTSTGQQKHDLANLTTRIAVKAEARQLVWREASPRVRAAWVGRVLDIDFPPYVVKALVADDTYRRTLQEALATYVGLASPEALAYVRVRQKIRTRLASQGAWSALKVAEDVFDEQGSIPPTTIRNGSVVLAASPLAGTGVALPEEVLELGRSESRLQVCLASCEVVDRHVLRLTGWAVIRAVDLTTRTPAIRLALVADAGRRVELAVDPVSLPEATTWVNWPHGSFDRAGFRTDINLDELGSGMDGFVAWHLRAHVEVDGLVRDGGVYHAVGGSSASRDAVGRLELSTGRVVGEPSFDRQHGFGIAVRPAT